jgi:SAM-dependent MidA family methyltransferase
MALQRELTLNEAEARHSARVHDLLAREIAAAGGWISFERFMDLALYAPGLGYYSAGAHKLGVGGDFTTAPEMSNLYGACLARQCEEVLRALGAGSILEIGAGSGRLAADILARLESLGRLPAEYWILEISADLRERQGRCLEQRVPHLTGRVRWLERPPEEPFDGIVLANEVLDALPVIRFRWYADRVEELGVTLHDGRFDWAPRPASPAVAEACRQLSAVGGAGAGDAGGRDSRAGDTFGGFNWDDGYVSEYCPRLPAWTHSVTGSLRAGAALWFDYGLPRSQYYLAERHEGTLICHFRQRAHGDPFLHPGLQDITAWVDFTRLAEASRPAGFDLAGFCTQAFFLAGAGIDQEMRLIAGQDENVFARLAHQARQLMLPGEMGERFKAMAWLRGMDVPLSGFALQDLRHTL